MSVSIRRIQWTRRALRRLDTIGVHIAKDNLVASENVVARIVASVNALAQFPSLGRVGRIAGTRENVIAGLPYIVPYRVKPDTIEVITVLHGAQKWPENF